MITSSSLKHPTMVDKIVAALILANDVASDDSNGHGKVYIQNAKGNNIMRLDVFQPAHIIFPAGAVIVYGEDSRQITHLVEEAIGEKLTNLLTA